MGSFKWHKALLQSHVLKKVLKEIPTYPEFYSLCHPKQQMKKKMKTKQLCVPFNYKFIHLKTKSNLYSFPMCLLLFSPSSLSHLAVRGEYTAIFSCY